MQGFMVDKDGDVVIENNEIRMVSGTELKKQTIRQVIGTNLGEWELNPEEGMDFSLILTKNYREEVIEDAINTAIKQVDDDMEITEFEMKVTDRRAQIIFTAKNSSGEVIEMEI